ncbi:MAG: ABC transporter ATP-binding protein [Tepidisphaeraceae bacterium]
MNHVKQSNIEVRGALSLQGLTKRFNGTDVAAIEDVSIDCKPGEFVVVVGPSGCGKSTLLSLAAGILKPDRGTVSIDGKPVRGPGPDRAVVFQDHGLFPWLTAAENIEFGLKMAGMPKLERQDRVAEALRTVHLTHSAVKRVHELSGGMRQRIAIARALVLDPAALLMDEPFASLDAQTRTLLHAQLQEVWIETRKTILFVTHSVGEAVRLADRIIVLHAHPGRVRRKIEVSLAHPRDFDSKDVAEVVYHVRKEIEEEVNRVHAEQADRDSWNPHEAARVDRNFIDLGGGI